MNDRVQPTENRRVQNGTEKHHEELNPTQARQGEKQKGMPSVLVVSIFAAVIAFIFAIIAGFVAI